MAETSASSAFMFGEDMLPISLKWLEIQSPGVVRLRDLVSCWLWIGDHFQLLQDLLGFLNMTFTASKPAPREPGGGRLQAERDQWEKERDICDTFINKVQLM